MSRHRNGTKEKDIEMRRGMGIHMVTSDTKINDSSNTSWTSPLTDKFYNYLIFTPEASRFKENFSLTSLYSRQTVVQSFGSIIHLVKSFLVIYR